VKLLKNVGVLNVKMDIVVKELKADVKEVAKRVDRLLYFIIIGGVLLEGGFEDECNWNRSKESLIFFCLVFDLRLCTC